MRAYPLTRANLCLDNGDYSAGLLFYMQQGKARFGVAWRGTVRPGKAWRGRALLGPARQGCYCLVNFCAAWRGSAGQGAARRCEAR